MKKRFCQILAATTLAVLAGTVAAEVPAEAGNCVACHGKAGVSSNPLWPNLAGQHESYLAEQLRAFRDGDRENPAMMPFVEDLSDAQIDSLAAYYSSLPLTVSASGDKALVNKGAQSAGYCRACHGMRGEPVANEWPIVAGQQAPYLIEQLKAYQSGARIHPLMQAAVSGLDEEDFKAVATFFSQLQP